MHPRQADRSLVPTVHLLARVVAAALLVAAAAAIVLVMRIGPVVATIAPGHGIHSGDLLGLLSASAALFTMHFRRGPAPRRQPA